MTLPESITEGDPGHIEHHEEIHATLNDGTGFAGRVCHVYHNANQGGAFSGFAWNLLTFNSEQSDDHGFHSTVTNPSRITPTTSGWYVFLVKAQASGSPTADGTFGLAVRKNGAESPTLGRMTIHQDAWSDDNFFLVTYPSSFNGTTDYVEAWFWWDPETDTSVNVLGDANPDTCYFACWRVSA